jgi:hypothetical protein
VGSADNVWREIVAIWAEHNPLKLADVDASKRAFSTMDEARALLAVVVGKYRAKPGPQSTERSRGRGAVPMNCDQLSQSWRRQHGCIIRMCRELNIGV